MPRKMPGCAVSPANTGTLLASGYIAGATLAGVAIAFLEFWPWLKDKLNYHQQIVGTFVDSRWFPTTLFVALIVVFSFWYAIR